MSVQQHSHSDSPAGLHNHQVLFYEDGAFPETTVADYLWEGLSASQSVVTAATLANTRILRQRLIALGADVDALERSGRLVMLDADAALSRFMGKTLPDRERFFAVIGAAIDQATAGAPARACRAFGEMVSVLVDAGNVDAAIELEHQWHDLLASRNCDLYCAYPMRQFAHASLAEPFLRICDKHGQVLPVPVGRDRHHGHNGHGRCVASLQQQARALQADIAERQKTEIELKRHRDHLEQLVRERTEELRIAKERAEVASAAKSAFLANMSHELRSPLNTILGFTRLMERNTALPETTRDDLRLVLKSGEHLHELISEVLDMSKLEAGRTTLNETDFDLDFVLDELRDLLIPAAAEKGLQLIFAPRPGVPHYLHGDPVKLRQILINLIGNAVKFTCQGSVMVSVETQGPAADGDRPRLLFSVGDTGIGIAPDELGNLFNPFVQARAGQQTRAGTGLGLAISRGFVRLMGGEMHMESEVGRGTTVSFDLPVQAAESLPVREDTVPRQVIGLAPDQPCYRILAVDDHAEARHLLVRLLAPLGFEVREAVNGQEAIELWRQWQPDLVWMDMRMPVLDGREATRRIRADPTGTRPIIIALTASSFEAERKDILAAGCDDMLRKPFREADLFAAMERHLAVRFIYQEAAPEPRAPLMVPPPVMLPDALRRRLEVAVVRLDPQGINQAIEAIGNIDAQFAQRLAASAGEFQYDAILSLIREEAQETKWNFRLL